MKVFEILNEAIDMEDKRKHFLNTITSNKDNLQKARTVIGVTQMLSKLFPEIKFKMLGKGTTGAHYDRESDSIVVHNTDKLMSASTVRNRWSYFVSQLVNLLTHEHLHKEQSARGGHKDYDAIMARKKSLGKNIKDIYTQAKQLTNLKDLYAEARDRGFDDEATKAQKQIDKIVAKGQQYGLSFVGTPRNYLSMKHEITAYAEQIADDLIRYARGMSGSDDTTEIRQVALDNLRQADSLVSGELLTYRSNFKSSEKPLKRLYKQIAQYIEQKTS